MENLRKIRFVVANYTSLQGLKAVPIGMCLLAVTIWSNSQRGPARNLAIPLALVFGFLLIYLLIERYYARTFGRVQRKPTGRRVETLFGVIFGIFALGAFLLDTAGVFPFSALGIVIGLGLLADYLRMNWVVRSHYLIYFPLMAVLIIILSLLSPGMWLAVGISSPVLGVLLLLGIFTVISGIVGHLFLVGIFSPKHGGTDGRTV